ncbi:DUF308 domain-containing protein [Novosphingobium sp. NBM11]|uniref:DUF308 domain-containing protein n=1 Tax=Novosphingobium sp. NBM11 TaxID=2596914 RepID=UPI001892056D|nr:DUF308 domain-containing protein [Novosphingobium sp. NBM11]
MSWTFIFVGALTVVSAFADAEWSARPLAALLGLIVLLIGVNLVLHPLAGIVSLTLLVGVMLLGSGVFRIMLGVGASQSGLRGALILSGGLALLLGAMIVADFPRSALVILGLLLAVDLISNGVSLILLSLARRQATRA